MRVLQTAKGPIAQEAFFDEFVDTLIMTFPL